MISEIPIQTLTKRYAVRMGLEPMCARGAYEVFLENEAVDKYIVKFSQNRNQPILIDLNECFPHTEHLLNY